MARRRAKQTSTEAANAPATLTPLMTVDNNTDSLESHKRKRDVENIEEGTITKKIKSTNNTPPIVHKDAPLNKARSKTNPAAKSQISIKDITATPIQNTTIGRTTRSSARLRAKEKAVEEAAAQNAHEVIMAHLQEQGRLHQKRLSQEFSDSLIPEGSARAVSPDLPRIRRGSGETVEPQLEENVNTYELLAAEADYVVSLFAAIIGEN